MYITNSTEIHVCGTLAKSVRWTCWENAANAGHEYLLEVKKKNNQTQNMSSCIYSCVGDGYISVKIVVVLRVVIGQLRGQNW